MQQVVQTGRARCKVWAHMLVMQQKGLHIHSRAWHHRHVSKEAAQLAVCWWGDKSRHSGSWLRKTLWQWHRQTLASKNPPQKPMQSGDTRSNSAAGRTEADCNPRTPAQRQAHAQARGLARTARSAPQGAAVDAHRQHAGGDATAAGAHDWHQELSCLSTVLITRWLCCRGGS